LAAAKGTPFKVRALTRNPQSAAAEGLKALPNVEVVKADIGDIASLEKAFAGAEAVFAMTNTYDPAVCQLRTSDYLSMV
jgi:uncharacterized protein YbjT (DUF2867 family)